MFFQVAESLARAQVPQAVRDATALQKPDGGVRGIMAGDIIRRVVARTMPQQLMEDVQKATASVRLGNKSRVRMHRTCLAGNHRTGPASHRNFS